MGVLRADGLVHIYYDKTVSPMKCNAFLMYKIQALSVRFRIKHRQKLIYSGYTIVQCLTVQDIADAGDGKEYDEVVSSEMGRVISRLSELLNLKDLTDPMTNS